MTTPRPLPQTVADYAEAALALASLIHAAEEAQWSPALTPRPREDTTERASGGHGDPTASIVTDDRRLALRAAQVTAEVALEAGLQPLREALATLTEAAEKWGF